MPQKSKRAAEPKKIYTTKDFTPPFVQRLIAEHGGYLQAARAIAHQCRDVHGNVPNPAAVDQWLRRASKVTEAAIYARNRSDVVNQIVNLLEEAGVPIEAVGKLEKVRLRSGFHEGLTKDPEGKPQVTRLRSKTASIVLSPKWEEGPQWPLMQPAKPVVIKPIAVPRPKRPAKCIVVLSDFQIGFLRTLNDPGTLIPTHDPQAISVAQKIVAYLQPDQIGYVGDFLDMAEASRYLQHAEFVLTTQPAIDAGYRILAEFESAAGPRKNRQPTAFVGGNHERRIREAIATNAKWAFNLRPATQTPEAWPDLSIGRLLHFKDLGIEYMGEFPGAEWWLTPRLVVRHDPQSKDSYEGSVIAGHSHHVKRSTFTSQIMGAQKTRTLYEIGCLCSLERNPDKRSLLATRVPSQRPFVKDWAHGFAVVWIMPDQSFHVEQVDYIAPNRAIFHGKEFTA